MNVALPEVDGRILSRAVSFKGEAFFDEATECPIATYRARATGSNSWPNWPPTGPACATRPNPSANSPWSSPTTPTRTAAWPMASGLDTPAGTVNVLDLLEQAGYRVAEPPADSDALMAGRSWPARPTG